MRSSRNTFTLLCFTLSAGVIALIFLVSNRGLVTTFSAKGLVRASNEDTKDEKGSKPGQLDNTFAENTKLVSKTMGTQPATKGVFPESNVGRSPSVAENLNSNTKSVAEAIKTRENPERLSAFIPPKPFDLAKYQANPQGYLDVVEPGRVFQAAAPGEGKSTIQEAGNQYFRVLQGESVVLRAKVDPLMPVTFYSPKLGQFENELTSITVKADNDGNVQATFKSSGGTRGEIDIIASSPVHSGFAKYIVDVSLPKVPANQSEN